MRIALATCRNLPDREVDDQALFRALDDAGIRYQLVAWDAPDADWSGYDACLIRTTWDYQERLQEYLDWIDSAGRVTRMLNAATVVHWNVHKSYLRELQAAGIPVAPSVWLARGESADVGALMAERGWRRGFIKPLIGASARETLRFDADPRGLGRAQAHLQRLLPREDLVVQTYLPSVESFGETSGLFFNHRLSHGVRKVPVPGDFRVQDDYGASDFPYELSERELSVAARALEYAGEKFGRLLYARVDFLHGPDGEVYLNELELIEPSLFLRHDKRAAGRLVAELQATLQTG